MPKIRKSRRQDRFNSSKTKFSRETYDSFDFGNSLNSYNDSTLYFTNFVKSKENELYKKLEEYIKESKYDDYSFFDNDFEPMDEIKYTEPAAKRLLEIINKGYHHNYSPKDLQNIFKVKHKDKDKKRFQFYIHNDSGNLKIILIDFFHLGIVADYHKDGKVIRMTKEKIYEKEKNNNWNLSNLKNI